MKTILWIAVGITAYIFYVYFIFPYIYAKVTLWRLYYMMRTMEKRMRKRPNSEQVAKLMSECAELCKEMAKEVKL